MVASRWVAQRGQSTVIKYADKITRGVSSAERIRVLRSRRASGVAAVGFLSYEESPPTRLPRMTLTWQKKNGMHCSWTNHCKTSPPALLLPATAPVTSQSKCLSGVIPGLLPSAHCLHCRLLPRTAIETPRAVEMHVEGSAQWLPLVAWNPRQLGQKPAVTSRCYNFLGRNCVGADYHVAVSKVLA
ncbi:uncharacterized protein LOC142559980 [Dermacentor variabilis]|uniref:uncharacterized protein LOC142559980 n=1 Tax=Dermacentor variabilis TaxID=34621 RepID=UPI003F5ADF98